jgi:hypothetical protein
MRYRPFSTLFGNWNVTSSVARMSEDDKQFFDKLDKAAAEAERQFMERNKCKQASPEQARSYPQRSETHAGRGSKEAWCQGPGNVRDSSVL